MSDRWYNAEPYAMRPDPRADSQRKADAELDVLWQAVGKEPLTDEQRQEQEARRNAKLKDHIARTWADVRKPTLEENVAKLVDVMEQRKAEESQ